MNKRIELLDDSLDWVKSRKLAVLVSFTPMLSALLEPFVALFLDPFARLNSPSFAFKYLAAFLFGLLPRIALAHLLWQTLQPETDERPIDETAKTFRRRGWLRWLLWSVPTVAVILVVENTLSERPDNTNWLLILIGAMIVSHLVVGFVVVLFHQRLLVRVLTVRQTPSHDGRSCLLFAMLTWLTYMEIYLAFGAVFTDQTLPFPVVLWLFAVVFCVTLLIRETARLSQLYSLQKNQLEGYQLRSRQETKLPQDVTLYPLLAGIPTAELTGVLMKDLAAPDGQPFRDESESMIPVAYSALHLNGSVELVKNRRLAVLGLLALHLVVMYLAVNLASQ